MMLSTVSLGAALCASWLWLIYFSLHWFSDYFDLFNRSAPAQPIKARSVAGAFLLVLFFDTWLLSWHTS